LTWSVCDRGGRERDEGKGERVQRSKSESERKKGGFVRGGAAI